MEKRMRSNKSYNEALRLTPKTTTLVHLLSQRTCPRTTLNVELAQRLTQFVEDRVRRCVVFGDVMRQR